MGLGIPEANVREIIKGEHCSVCIKSLVLQQWCSSEMQIWALFYFNARHDRCIWLHLRFSAIFSARLLLTLGHTYWCHSTTVTTEPSDEGNLSLGFIQLRTHQHLQRNTTNAWYETRNHLTSTCDTNDQAKQCNSTRHVIKQCNSARHVIRLISGGIETKPSQWKQKHYPLKNLKPGYGPGRAHPPLLSSD